MNSNILSIDGTHLTSGTTPLQGGYQALGVSGKKAVIFSKLSKEVVFLGPTELKEMNLKAVLGAKWCEEHYDEFDPKKEVMVFNHRRLASDILTECQG